MNEPRDPDYRARVHAIFHRAHFIQELGIQLVSVDPGRCSAESLILPKHRQQHGYVHAGVIATLADHAAGGAAGTLVEPSEMVLTAEFKINFLRPASGNRLRADATVLKAGRTLSVAEAEVYASKGDQETLVAKAMVTLAVVPSRG